jgi:hypothetical protein
LKKNLPKLASPFKESQWALLLLFVFGKQGKCLKISLAEIPALNSMIEE